MNFYFGIFALLMIVSLLIQFLVAGPRRFRNRVNLLTEYTTRRGYRLANPALAQITGASARDLMTNPSLKSYSKASDGITDIEGLERGTADPFAFTVSLQSKEAMIFELSVSSQRADGKGGTYHYRVAKIPQAGLPRFSLGRNSFASTVQNVVDKLVHKPESTIAVDSRNFPEFTKHYWLKGLDSQAVLAFLSPEKIFFLQNVKFPGIIAANSHYFVYFELGRLQTERDYDNFIQMVEKLAANLL
jgi:hypothetical protein